MRSEIRASIIVGVASIIIATTIGIAIVNSATGAAEAKYRSMLREHYIQEHLEPDELTIVRFGNSQVSQLLADGLMGYGATINIYDNFEVPGYMPSKDAIYIFEEAVMREARDDPALHEFLRNATAHHATIIAVGDNPNILYQVLNSAGVNEGGAAIGPLAGFKLSEKGGITILSPGSSDGKDWAFSVLQTAREEELYPIYPL